MNLSLGLLSLNLPNRAPVLITILKIVSCAGWTVCAQVPGLYFTPALLLHVVDLNLEKV